MSVSISNYISSTGSATKYVIWYALSPNILSISCFFVLVSFFKKPKFLLELSVEDIYSNAASYKDKASLFSDSIFLSSVYVELSLKYSSAKSLYL
jgi:hypothetical protein